MRLLERLVGRRGDDARIADALGQLDARRRAIQVLALLVVAGLVAALAPGLGELRDTLAGVDPAWLALGAVFELLSCMSYVLMFRPIFCDSTPWRRSWQIPWSAARACRRSR